jgi:hypothetical protein
MAGSGKEREAARRLAKLATELEAVEREHGATVDHVERLLASRSWRLTAPVRALGGWLKGRPKQARGAGRPPRTSRQDPQRTPASAGNPASAAGPVIKPSQSGGCSTAAKVAHPVGQAGPPGWQVYEGRLRSLQAVALGERSTAALDLIAEVASAGRHAFAGIRQAWESGGVPALIECCRHPTGTLVLARVVGNMQPGPWASELSLDLYERYLRDMPAETLEVYDHVLRVDLLQSAGRVQEAIELLGSSGLDAASPWDWICLRANLTHPTLGHSPEAWLAALNRLFIDHGLEATVLKDGTGPLLNRVTCEAPPVGEGGPLVSVLMATHRSDDSVDVAIASVLGQTWRNLELIVIDDCSSEPQVARLEQWAARDRRVRLIRTARNVGAYAARNRGLAEARGTFVTCHDSDDWSHPRKLELQVRHLLSTPGSVANMSNLARVTEDLRIVRFNAKGVLVFPNSSSLMFRREPVVTRIGYWDSARSGSDTEYCKRLEMVFGTKAAPVADAPLSFARTSEGGLTSGTLGRGYASPERRAYMAAFLEWHERIRNGASPYLDGGTMARPFAIPRVLQSETLDSPPSTRFDVVCLGDFCDSRTAAAHAREIDALAGEGRVAICHVRSYSLTSIGSAVVARPIQRLANEEKVAIVPVDGDVSCDRLLVLTPAVLPHLNRQACRISTNTVEVRPFGTEPVPSSLLDVARGIFRTARRVIEGPAVATLNDMRAKGSLPSATHAPPRTSAYWEGRKNHLYYQVVRVLAEELSAGARSVIDVGSNNCPYLDWLAHLPVRTSIDLRRPYVAPGVRAIQADFLAWNPDQEYDIALCLQVIEHVPDAQAFAQKLLTLAPVVIVSVPYKWPPGKTKGHVHDPVDEAKMMGWFGTRPSYEYICREVLSSVSRLIQVYERDGSRWDSLRSRERKRNLAQVTPAEPKTADRTGV